MNQVRASADVHHRELASGPKEKLPHCYAVLVQFHVGIGAIPRVVDGDNTIAGIVQLWFARKVRGNRRPR